jgi:hypothetical protein
VFGDGSNNSSGTRGCSRGQEANQGEGVAVAGWAAWLGRGERWKSHSSLQSLSSSTSQHHSLFPFAGGNITSGREVNAGWEGGGGSVFMLLRHCQLESLLMEVFPS